MLVMRDSEVLYAKVGILDKIHRAERMIRYSIYAEYSKVEVGESANCLLAATLNLQ